MLSVTASGDHHGPARGLFLRRDGRLFLEPGHGERGVKAFAWKGTTPAMFTEQCNMNTPAGKRPAQQMEERGVFPTLAKDLESGPATGSSVSRDGAHGQFLEVMPDGVTEWTEEAEQTSAFQTRRQNHITRAGRPKNAS